jgi:predicted RNA-binding protein with RPS1 domain
MHPPAVQVGDILPGTIVRVETYGAFCALQPQLQGLIHISQLAEMRVEKVEDVVAVDDEVWVKVLQVEEDDRNRWRIRLSMKDVSQDGTRLDLGREREEREQAQDQLGMNLNSMIGMGVARDPMADNHRLTMKNNLSAAKTTFRGGYSLVGDDEGELEKPVAPVVTVAVAVAPTERLPPIGRGRGATLPAWMTTGKGDGPTGIKSDNDNDSDDDRSGKKSHKKHSKSRRKKHSKHSKKDRKHRRRRHRSRSRSRDSDSSKYEDAREHRRGHRSQRRRSARVGGSESRSDDDREERRQRRRRSKSRDSTHSKSDDSRDESNRRSRRSSSRSESDREEQKPSRSRIRSQSRDRVVSRPNDEDVAKKEKSKNRTPSGSRRRSRN